MMIGLFWSMIGLGGPGLGCQMLQGVCGFGASGSSFCLLLRHFQSHRAGLVARCFRVLGARVLRAVAFRFYGTFKAIFGRAWLPDA